MNLTLSHALPTTFSTGPDQPNSHGSISQMHTRSGFHHFKTITTKKTKSAFGLKLSEQRLVDLTSQKLHGVSQQTRSNMFLEQRAPGSGWKKRPAAKCRHQRLGTHCHTHHAFQFVPKSPVDPKGAGVSENPKRAHLRVPALQQTPPKFHEKTTKRGRKKEGKKSEIFGGPAEGGPGGDPKVGPEGCPEGWRFEGYRPTLGESGGTQG